MAEMAPIPFVDTELEESTLYEDFRPHLELVERDVDRPPKLTTDEADYLLARGPYVARLRAGQRILSAAASFANDEQTASIISPYYLDSLRSDVSRLAAELRTYDIDSQQPAETVTVRIDDDEITPELEVDVPSTPARRVGRQAVRTTTGRDIEGRDSVGLYLEEIARTPLLNAELEVELSKTIEAGLMAEHLLEEGLFVESDKVSDQPTREELEWLAEQGKLAVDRFLTSNLRLVVSIARKYGRSQMPMLDLIQEGNVGLIRAVEKFDYTKGYKFSTYATWWVRQAITRGIAQQGRVVRLPVHVVEELNQVNSARRTVERQLGRDPEPDEIAAELGMDVERVIELIAWGREHVSLDAPVDEDGDTTIGDLYNNEAAPGLDAGLLDTESSDRLNSLVDHLDERSADIIRRRYGLKDGRQHKLADVGVVHGISAERVRQLEREAIARLRRIADPDLGRA
jgi:RNA polymerase primary sigma factor